MKKKYVICVNKRSSIYFFASLINEFHEPGVQGAGGWTAAVVAAAEAGRTVAVAEAQRRGQQATEIKYFLIKPKLLNAGERNRDELFCTVYSWKQIEN